MCTVLGVNVFILRNFRQFFVLCGEGLWYYQPGASLPSLTMVGSSNFGYRYRTPLRKANDAFSSVAIMWTGAGLAFVNRNRFIRNWR